MEWAENGEVCVDKFKNSAPGFFDAILMDIHMPVMDGYEATKQIRALERPDRNIPVIAMTADAFLEDVKQCIDCGMDDHLPKPPDLNELVSVLQRFLAEKD